MISNKREQKILLKIGL